MTIRCGVCKLPLEKREAVEAALGGDIALAEIAATSGISASSLSRHATRHMKNQAQPRVTKPAVTKLPARPLVPVTQAEVPAEPLAVTDSLPAPTKDCLMNRLELLWNESLAGLEAAKESVVLTKSDGSRLEVPGDLRSRAAFIREGRSVLEILGLASGELGAATAAPPPAVVRIIAIPRHGQPSALAIEATGANVVIEEGE